MKRSIPTCGRKGFTLVELLVSMAITTLIVTVLVSITSIALDTWNRSRAELRASRQAKAMVDAMAKDFESMVTRRGNAFEWMVVKQAAALPGTGNMASTNAAEVVFFTVPTDRYQGNLTDPASKGDVSAVGYLLDFKDPIADGGDQVSSYVLNRLVVNPDVTFTNLLGKPDLMTEFNAYRSELVKSENFVCENIYQFTVVFHVEITETINNVPTTRVVPVGIAPGQLTELRFKGTGIEALGTLPVTADLLKAGRLRGVELSLTVLTDGAANRVRRSALPSNADELAKFLAGNSFNYSRYIPLASL